MGCGGGGGGNPSTAGPSDAATGAEASSDAASASDAIGVDDASGSCTAGAFPTIAASYFDPTKVSAQAFSYQMADFDAPRHRALFYPYGSITTPKATSGAFLTYDVSRGAFTDPASWTSTDLTEVVGPGAVDFGGGFIDPVGGFAYLSAGAQGASPVTVKIDLAKQQANPNDATAYAAFQPRSLPGIPYVGSFAGTFAAGHAYFSPTLDGAKDRFHGTLLRYDATGAYGDARAWSYFDLTTLGSPSDPALGGMQSLTYLAPYLYLVPFANGSNTSPTLGSKLVRYDTTKPFDAAASYEVFDLSTLSTTPAIRAQLGGFTGGIVAGTRIIFVPWGIRTTMVTNSVALAYDTTKALADASAWALIDLTSVDPKAGGYQFGWLDRDGYLWMVPTHNYHFVPAAPPFLAYDTKRPFTCASSWKAYPNDKPIWSTGAAYDPSTNTAWLSPYGTAPGGMEPALMTQLALTTP
jgi:hypothetical protein